MMQTLLIFIATCFWLMIVVEAEDTGASLVKNGEFSLLYIVLETLVE